jgi:glycosyltransferase involved in cell wall biosynthesis
MPRISVIVPTRKRNHLLPRSLGSILAQTWNDFEIVVVDDNPADQRIQNDPTLASLLNNPKIRVLEHATPKNASSARNFGLSAVNGEWVTYLDDDDAYDPRKLEMQWQCAQNTGCPVGICGATYHLAARMRRRVDSRTVIPRNEMLLAPFCFPSVFHKRADHTRFDETLSAGEDSHYFFQLLRDFDVKEVFNAPDLLVHVYPQPGPRVNVNRSALRQANDAVYRDFSGMFDPHSTAIFKSRAELQDCRYEPGGYWRTIQKAIQLMRIGGTGEARLILNTFLFKFPLTRKWVVS